MLRKSWIWLPAFNLMLAVLFGVLLRMAFVIELPWLDFRNFMHAHSHVAMLGWALPVLILFLYHAFCQEFTNNRKGITILFWVLQVSVIGMAIMFSLEGYGVSSGAFSALNGLTSYALVFLMWKNRRVNHGVSGYFFNAALFFYLFSTIAIWVLPILVSLGERGTVSYYLTIQFFLHFQFNGWLIFSVLALFIKELEDRGVRFDHLNSKRFFWLLFSSCFLTFALALSWASPIFFVFVINSIGVLIQLISLWFLTRILRSIGRESLRQFQPIVRYLLIFSVLAFYLKIIIQFMVWVPDIATVAYTIRNLVIGFFHLVFLGIFTLFALAYAFARGYISRSNNLSVKGLWVFIAAVILSELIIFGQGVMFWGNMGFLPFYYWSLFVVSALFPLGLGMIMIGQYGHKEMEDPRTTFSF